MRRDEIVKALRCCNSETECRGCPFEEQEPLLGPCAEKVLSAAADMLEQDAKKASWISVKDRMPEDDATYLVYGRNGYGIVFAVYYGDGEWLTCDDLTNITRFVTHWMPMPEPPKENGEMKND